MGKTTGRTAIDKALANGKFWRVYRREILLSKGMRRALVLSLGRGILMVCGVAATGWGLHWWDDQLPMEWGPILTGLLVLAVAWVAQFLTLVADGYAEFIQEMDGDHEDRDPPDGRGEARRGKTME